jgi:hypothetical protein
MGRSGGAETVRLMTIRRPWIAGTQGVIPGNEGSHQMGDLRLWTDEIPRFRSE